MQKVGELFASSAGHAAKDEQVQGSGGGGPCEAVFWVKEKGTQWRIKGTAFVVAPDIEGGEDERESSGVRTVKSEIGGRMRVVEGAQDKEGEWSWGRELTGHFGNCSPGMRGIEVNCRAAGSRALTLALRFLEEPSARCSSERRARQRAPARAEGRGSRGSHCQEQLSSCGHQTG